MFLLGHSVWGYAFSKVTGRALRAEIPMDVAFLSGVLPDFDLYFGNLGLVHHTYAHSLLFLGPIAAILIAKFGTKGLVVSVGILSHLFTDWLVGAIPIFYPLSAFNVGLNLGIPSAADTLLEDGMLIAVMMYMLLNGDAKLLLTKRADNLRLLIPLVAIVSLSLLFSQDNNIPLVTYAFSRKALGAISVGHMVLGAILAVGVIQGIRWVIRPRPFSLP